MPSHPAQHSSSLTAAATEMQQCGSVYERDVACELAHVLVTILLHMARSSNACEHRSVVKRCKGKLLCKRIAQAVI